MQCDSCNKGTYVAPGLVLARAEGRSTPAQSQLYLVRLEDSSKASRPLDLRLGFLESRAGAKAFVAAHGGDDGSTMDPWFGTWGVDGAYLRWLVSKKDGHWVVGGCGAFRVGGGEDQLESARLNYCAGDVKADAAPVGPSDLFDLGLDAGSPLPFSWRVYADTQGETLLVVTFHQTHFVWLLDDGAAIDGLRHTGNAASPSGYQGGALDLGQPVPFFYVGEGDNTSSASDLHTAELGLYMARPQLDAPARVLVNQPVTMTITMLDGNDEKAEPFAGHVRLTCPGIGLDRDITFKPAEAGVHQESVAFTATGTFTCTAADPAADVLSSAVTLEVVEVGTADLKVSVHLDADPVTAGELVGLSVFVTNNLGPDDAHDVQLEVTLPAGSSFVDASGAGWTCQGSGTVTCHLPLLLQTDTATLPVHSDAPTITGAATWKAHAFAVEQDPSTGDQTAQITATVVAPASVQAELTATPAGEAIAGDRIALQLVVTNQGPEAIAPGEVRFRLPVGTALVAGSQVPAGSTLPGTIASKEIAAGQTARFGFDVTLLPDAPASIEVSATFTAPPADPLSRTLTIPVAAAATLTATCKATVVNPGDVFAVDYQVASARLCPGASLLATFSSGLELEPGSVRVGALPVDVSLSGAAAAIPLAAGADPLPVKLEARVLDGAGDRETVVAAVRCGSRAGSAEATIAVSKSSTATFLLGGCATAGAPALWLFSLLAWPLRRRAR